MTSFNYIAKYISNRNNHALVEKQEKPAEYNQN